MTVFFAQNYQMPKRDLEKASKQDIAQQLVKAMHDALHHLDQKKAPFAD